MVGVRAHKMDSWELELFPASGTCFLIEIPCCALHFVYLRLEIVYVVQVLIKFLVGSLDRVLLIF